jgi:hypothetical protein
MATSAVREVKRARANHVFAQFYFSADAWKRLGNLGAPFDV